MTVKANELRDLSLEELKDKEHELNQELFNLRFQTATGELGNTAMRRIRKKDLARVKTVLRGIQISSGAN
jgi:large subunit ribosomal protein L29